MPTSAAHNTLSTDFISGTISRKHYKNQWDMGQDDFVMALELWLQQTTDKPEKIFINWDDVDSQTFVDSFGMAQEAFLAGKVKKLVPIAVQNGHLRRPLTLVQKARCLKQLSMVPGHLYPYGEWNDRSGFMGATPEILFEKMSARLETMALAGTSGKDVPLATFLRDPKERKEHQFVVDDISVVLSPLGLLKIGETTVVEFPSLNHLQTKMSIDIEQPISTEELIKKMHPTPALGIYPRGEYFKTFATFPLQAERGSFGAPWGIESESEAFLLVGIRKWDWSDRAVKIFAGCGVVQESVIEKEFAEILKKIDSVKRIFFQD